MFEWDRNNLRKIRAHRIKREEAGELRVVYYGETTASRLLAVIVTERRDHLRVITAYGLDAGQRRDYLQRRTQGE